ncbi:MAG: peptidylprolyl isomerase [Bacteroidota bacterium]
MKSDLNLSVRRTALFLLLTWLLVPAWGMSQGKKKKVKPDAIISTNYGDIKIKLYEETPTHRNNFLKLAKDGFYDGTTFHRVIKKFMIQGGDPNTKDPAKVNLAGQGGPGYTLPAEILPGYIHKKGVLSAARLGDQVNPQRESSGSQFYIVQGQTFTAAQLDQAEKRIGMSLGREFSYTPEQRAAYINEGGSPWLDQQYTIFGEVIEGIEVIDKIAAVETLPGDRPKIEVTMTVVAKAKPKKLKKPKKKKEKS